MAYSCSIFGLLHRLQGPVKARCSPGKREAVGLRVGQSELVIKRCVHNGSRRRGERPVGPLGARSLGKLGELTNSQSHVLASLHARTHAPLHAPPSCFRPVSARGETDRGPVIAARRPPAKCAAVHVSLER